jgi:DNA polymerase I
MTVATFTVTPRAQPIRPSPSTPSTKPPKMLDLPRSARKALVHAIVEPYLTAKKDQTILSQYERVAPGPDGRIRTVLSPVVTETGRLASGESFVDAASTNLQNLSKKEAMKDPLYRVRDCFIPDPGMVLLAIDYEKAEAFVASFESEDWFFYEALHTGKDVHKWLAALAYHGGNEKSVTKMQRQNCKNCYYASLYRAGVSKITRTINQDAGPTGDRITEAEVAKIHAIIMKETKLQSWWDKVWVELMDPTLYGGERWLENCLGFRRMFYNPNTYQCHTEAINFFPQSTVATRMDQVIIESLDTTEEPGQCELLLQVHDELLWQVRADRAMEFAERHHAMFVRPFQSRGRSVFIPAAVSLGPRWGQLEEVKLH